MGTIFDQKLRKTFEIDLNVCEDYYSLANRLSSEKKITFDQALKIIDISVRDRANHLYRANGDSFDEQMSSLGEILSEIKHILDDK